METNIKAYDVFKRFYEVNENFRLLIDKYMETGDVRFFGEDEWRRIDSQNFVSPIPEMKEFRDLFLLGYNYGNCVGTAWQLSFSYNDVDIVSGILPMLKGTLNAEKEGGHCWLETRENIIDTTLMLVINKKLKSEFGYIEEQRRTSGDLVSSPNYQARKEFVNDKSIKRG